MRNVNDLAETISLSNAFGTEEIDDQVVRFTTQSSIGSLTLDFALFSDRTPGTRANFLSYVNEGDYDNSIIHRSIPGFIIQGGAFYDSDTSSNYFLSSIPTDPPIVNEFAVSNTYGTVSMAKQSGDPDSATASWFVSIGNNSENLDNQNEGFTVFGKITKSTLNNATSLGNPTDFPRWNFGGAFANLPLSPAFNGSRALVETDFLLFQTVQLVNISASDAGSSTALTYSLLNNSSPSVVSVSITETDAALSYLGSVSGTSIVTVRATDSVGNTVDDSFTVTISTDDFDDWKSANFSSADSVNPAISAPEVDLNGDGLTNLELYLHNLIPPLKRFDLQR